MTASLTMREFSHYLAVKQPEVIIYNNENDDEYAEKHSKNIELKPLSIKLTFNNISTDGKTIVLRSNSGYVVFRLIKKISFELQESVLGDVIIIYCMEGSELKNYTLILR